MSISANDPQILQRNASNNGFQEVNGAGAIRSVLGTPHVFDVKKYGASGIIDTTTGSISSGSASLTVSSAAGYEVGQGILIKGAGTAGAHLVSTISAISGTTFTLAANAATTVSGAVVQHDDTAAINSAIAAAFSNSGGTVYLPMGVYRCNGPFDGTSNGILTIPFATGVTSYAPMQITLMGESEGMLDDYDQTVGTGVTLLFTDHPTASGSYPSAFAGSAYSTAMAAGTSMNCVGVNFENVQFILPSNPTISGIRVANNSEARIGDHVRVIALATGDFTFEQPTTTTSHGIWMPQRGNNVMVYVGSVFIAGFYNGLKVMEHAYLARPEVANCWYGLVLPPTYHPVTGVASLEVNRYSVVCTAGALDYTVSVDLTVTMEEYATGSAWNYPATNGNIYDPDNKLKGIIRYSVLVVPGSHTSLQYTGCANVALKDIALDGTEVSPGGLTINGDAGVRSTQYTILGSGGTSTLIRFNMGSLYGTATAGKNLKQWLYYNGDDTLTCGFGMKDDLTYEQTCARDGRFVWYKNYSSPSAILTLANDGTLTAAGRVKGEIPNYADDAAADADTGLLSGQLYRTTAGGRTVYRKP